MRVFYPVTDPLHKQARKQFVRLFSASLFEFMLVSHAADGVLLSTEACADAMKIEPPPASRHSYSGYSECVLEGEEEDR